MPRNERPIHQIYATHCTYGTSAIERGQGEAGEAGEAVLGYSARAGSMVGDQLRELSLAVERFVSYDLPADAPSDLVLRLESRHAPRRFFYCPSASGLRVLGQVCFRQKDSSTPADPGSYFGHLLTTDEDAARWDVLDCLRLWNAPGWRTEDGPDIPFELESFETFEALLKGFLHNRQGPDYDAILEQFLDLPSSEPGASAPAGGSSSNPQPESTGGSAEPPSGSLPQATNGAHRPPPPPPRRKKSHAASRADLDAFVPSRWKAVPVEQRQRFFRTALSGYLDVAAGRRGSLLLVAEPEMVVLMVYAIARLLPRGGIREGISFSTYEGDPDRLLTSIAGIAFHHYQTDLPAERYEQDFVVNTHNGEVSRSQGSGAAYVRVAWEEALVKKGLQHAALVVAGCESGRIRQIPDLNLARHGEEATRKVLDPAADLSSVNYHVPILDGYVGRRVGEQLALTPHDHVEQLAESPEHRRAVLDLASSQTVCESQVVQLIRRLDEQELELFLNMSGVAPPYVQAALEHCVDIIPPGGAVAFLKSSSLREKHKQKLLPYLTGKLPAEELEEFLALETVPAELKEKAVERLAKELPGARICPFLERSDIGPELKQQALPALVPNVPRQDWLTFLRLSEVASRLKIRLIEHNADKFNGQEALAVLTDPGVPGDCRSYAATQPSFLGRVDRKQLGPVLQLEVVPPTQKNHTLDRLERLLSGEDLVAILRSPKVPNECKAHVLSSGPLAGKLSGEQLLALTLDRAVPEAFRLEILGSHSMSAGLPAPQMAALLKDPRLSPACKETACGNPAFLKRIPKKELAPLLTSKALPESCREAVFAHLTTVRGVHISKLASVLADPRLPGSCKLLVFSRDDLVEQLTDDQLVRLLKHPRLSDDLKQETLDRPAVFRRIPSDQIVPLLLEGNLSSLCQEKCLRAAALVRRVPDSHIVDLLVDGRLPEPVRQAAFDQESLLARIPADDVVRLLCDKGLPASYKEKAIDRKEVFGRIRPQQALPLLRHASAPAACKNRIARVFAEQLPDDDVVPFLELQDVDLSAKGKALESHAPRLSSEHVAALLKCPKVPTQCKIEAIGFFPFFEKALEGDVLGLLRHEHVPPECKQELAEQSDFEVVPQERVVELLEVSQIPEPRKKKFLRKRAGKLTSQQVRLVLSSQAISEELKQYGLKLPELVGRLGQDDALDLMGDPNVSDECFELLLGKLPDDMTLEQLLKLLETGKVPEAAQPGIIREHVKDHPDRIIPLLRHEKTPQSVKDELVESFADRLPESEFPDLLKLGGVGSEHKGRALARFFEQNKRLPNGCQALWVEEFGLAEWPAGPMCEFLRRFQAGDTTKPLLEQERNAAEKVLENPEVCRLSFYVSLLKACSFSLDAAKIELFSECTEELIKRRRMGDYAPAGPSDLYRILACVLPLLEEFDLLPQEMCESLGSIAYRVLEDLLILAAVHGDQVMERLRTLETQFRGMLSLGQQRDLDAWKGLLKELDELGQVFREAKGKHAHEYQIAALDASALSQSGRKFCDVRDGLIQKLYVLFNASPTTSALPVSVQLDEIRGVAAQLGVDVEDLKGIAAARAASSPEEIRRKRQKSAALFLIGLLAGCAITALAGGKLLLFLFGLLVGCVITISLAGKQIWSHLRQLLVSRSFRSSSDEPESDSESGPSSPEEPEALQTEEVQAGQQRSRQAEACEEELGGLPGDTGSSELRGR
jgi:hypothetical protein